MAEEQRAYLQEAVEERKLVGVREEGEEDRVRWRQIIHCGHH